MTITTVAEQLAERLRANPEAVVASATSIQTARVSMSTSNGAVTTMVMDSATSAETATTDSPVLLTEVRAPATLPAAAAIAHLLLEETAVSQQQRPLLLLLPFKHRHPALPSPAMTFPAETARMMAA